MHKAKRHYVLPLALLALCAGRASADDGFARDDWPMYNHDARGTRANRGEHLLSADNVSRLRIKWSFDTAGVVNATPIVRDDTIYFGDGTGLFYAVRRDGSPVWKTQVKAPITASALATDKVVVFGDLAGFLYGLDRRTGKILWSERADPHPLASIFASPISVDPWVAIAVASTEEQAAADPNYPCCSSRGSVLMLRPEDGSIVWQTFTISDAERSAGASGAGIWSTPTFDHKTGLLYVSTGNNYTVPTTGMSDAVLALDAFSGTLIWVNQRTPNDSWNFRFPWSLDHPDADFGDSPQIYRLSCGRTVVGAGQKSGFYHVLDALTGEVVAATQWYMAGPFGGIFADSAVSDGKVFVNGENWQDTNGPPAAGTGITALSADGTTQLWHFDTPGSPDMSGISVANGVVYFQSVFDGQIRALDEKSGAMLATIPIGPAISGPSIAGGQVYVGTGLPFGSLTTPSHVIALGL
jgi:polyvinyl alcohol dehydrogenase (cytochrome)